MRGGRYAIRTRDAESPVFTEFAWRAHLPYNPEWEVTARFEPYPAPVEVPISTRNPLVDGVHRTVGEVVFRLPGSPTSSGYRPKRRNSAP
ncbi:hypothetical protein [Pseudarthrobacter chlorophenolicus]|uniref:hypothetical protein n=1 Tax=Pseudarthrobacter chlorophenolicus TaxID=85085 RepID=UPI0039088E8A